MDIQAIDVKYQLLSQADPASVNVSGKQRLGTALATVTFTDTPLVAYSMGLLISAGDALVIDFATGAVTGTVAGTNQRESATIVAAAGATTAGNLSVTVTSALVTGSPLAVSVPLTLDDDDASKVATAVRASLNSTPAITTHYSVGGTGADYTLTAILKAANDATLNLAHANDTCVGITTATTSTNTTAGVGTSMAYKVAGTAWDASDYEGNDLPTMTKVHALLFTTASTAGTVEFDDATNVITRSAPFVDLSVAPAGNHAYSAGTLTLTAASAPVTMRLDVLAG